MKKILFALTLLTYVSAITCAPEKKKCKWPNGDWVTEGEPCLGENCERVVVCTDGKADCPC